MYLFFILRSYDTRNHVSKTLRWTKNPPSPDPPSSPGLLSRWFSLRRCSQYDLDVRPNSKMPLLPEVYRQMIVMSLFFTSI